MSLKTSFCNKAIIKADIKRFWWVSVLYTLGIFLFYTFNYIYSFYNNYSGMYYNTAEYTASRIYGYGAGVWILALIIPVVLSSLLFSYMQSGASSTFSHSIPVTRKQTFVSHTVSGLIMIVFPHIVNTAIFLIYRFDSSFAESFKVSHLLITMYTGLIYSFLAFSCATFMSFVAGNVISAGVFTYVLAFLPITVEAFINEFLRIQLFGYNNYSAIFEKIYIMPASFVSIKYIAYYVILSFVFLLLGFLVYRLRNLENHSEVVAFPKLKPFFIYGVAISFGCVGYLYFNGIFGFENPLFLIPFGVIGIIVAKMISQKTFRINGVFKNIIIYGVCIFALFVVFNFDLTGYEGRVPAIETVESIRLDLDINNDESTGWDRNGNIYNYDYVFEPVVKDTDEMADIIKLHRVITENRENIEAKSKNNYHYNDTPINLTYTLKNGKTLERRYSINYDSFRKYVNAVAEGDAMRKAYFPILRDRDVKINFVSISDDRIYPDKAFVTFYGDDGKFLLDALKGDLIKADANDYAGRGETFTSVMINYTKPAHYQNGDRVSLEYLTPVNERYYIRPSYTDTKLIIEGFDEFESIYKASDIDKIGIENYNGNYDDRKTVTIGDNSWEFSYVIEKYEDIERIYNYLESDGFNPRYSDCHLTIILKDGRHFNYNFNSNDSGISTLLKLNN